MKKLFGSKADRDMKEIKPILDKVLAAYDRIDKLSDDGLRAETDRIKEVIHNKIAADEGSLSVPSLRTSPSPSRKRRRWPQRWTSLPRRSTMR